MANDTPTTVADPVPGTPKQDMPAWFPAWARSLAEQYFSGTTCVFVLHGNVHDLFRCQLVKEDVHLNLSEFLASQVFGTWDVVLQYDLGRGLRALAGSDRSRLQTMMQYLYTRLGQPETWPREQQAVLLALDRLLERNLLEEDASKRKSIGIVLEYGQYLVPAGDLNTLAREQAANLIRILGWSQNPYLKRVNVAVCLIADKLTEVNPRLVQSPHVSGIEVPLPSRDERERYCQWSRDRQKESAGGLTPAELSQMSTGLNLVNLQVLLARSREVDRKELPARLKQLKKILIERQCQGLLEFVEPKHTLDLVVGHQAAKDRLRKDAELISRGQLEAAPMGYLLCGAVGTGKSFLAECYAGSIGIPCVKLRNFRSKYVGETEGNLELVLTALRSLGPVVVLIDEADAALGTREAEGDSGTSSRVFAQIASQMGDTVYRGRIIWMLLTSRPELLPIDLKRQGRAEVHIPLFYPQDEEEVRAMMLAMAKKNKVALSADALPSIKKERYLSGSDIESVVLAAHRSALESNRTQVTKADLETAWNEFIPSAQGLEKEMQELAAVLECTQLQFLPLDWRAKVTQPNGRSNLQERLVAIRQLLED